MTEHDLGQEGWILVDRVARSLAHSVGNAINVVSGRLSLVEADSTLTGSTRASLERAQDRLRRLHTDLRGALKFSAPPEQDVDVRLCKTLQELRDAGLVTSLLWNELEDCSVQADGTQAASSLPLLRVNTAYRQLAAKPVAWVVNRSNPRELAAITLRIEFQPEDLPADRRALTEPWFSPEAQSLPASARYGRLLLAEGLALLDEAQVAISVESGAVPDGSWHLLLAWPLRVNVNGQ